MLISRHQSIGQNRNIKIGNISFESVQSSVIWDSSDKSKFD
jgi:hypothetical protein